jgi:hypothetical protein
VLAFFVECLGWLLSERRFYQKGKGACQVKAWGWLSLSSGVIRLRGVIPGIQPECEETGGARAAQLRIGKR